jgi:1-acyl-sn-glycerol-3-phosphate acyltransferase
MLGTPSAKPGVTYRLLRRIWLFAAWLLRIRLTLEGAEHLPRDAGGRPAGGWIAAVVPHRTWVDPFVAWILLPERPRSAFFGDSRTMARSPLRRFVVRRLGGVIPIPARPDPASVPLHLGAAQRALEAGMVFMLMPEVGPASRPGELRRLGRGLAYVALRTRAPIIPLVLGGNDELYLGRRIILRALAPLHPGELAGIANASDLPEPGTAREREAARRLTLALSERVRADVAAVQAAAEPPPGTPKRGRFLTTLFR